MKPSPNYMRFTHYGLHTALTANGPWLAFKVKITITTNVVVCNVA